MSTPLPLAEGENVFSLGKREGAIVFRENDVELLLPNIDLDAVLPEHLTPLMALALILGDNKRLQEAIDVMNANIAAQDHK